MTGRIVPVMDIGGTHVTGALVDTVTRAVLPDCMVREGLDSNGTAEQIVVSIGRCASRLPRAAASDWTIALPGPFDYPRGIGQFEGVGKFESLRGVDLRAALSALVPQARSFRFLNDADAFALGEWWAGAAEGRRRAVGITLGTGVGSSFLDDGRVVGDGAAVPPHGRAHLLSYEGLPLEETVSRRAIRDRYAQVVNDRDGRCVDVHEIAARARLRDGTARSVLADAFAALGSTLAPWLAAFEASVLVVGGSMAASWDLIVKPLSRGIDIAAPGLLGHLEVTPARRLHDAALIGAALANRAAGAAA
ncbi:ROK family protein [Streptomyces sp. NBC_00829]|uniref:ROK family protein n=1 Tax=Streptomyces sp. NBC_00829 TaxID=2903679 RepID=UPI003864F694|nr:ROK family protein [Streptomyces sp. NBC_00829]